MIRLVYSICFFLGFSPTSLDGKIQIKNVSNLHSVEVSRTIRPNTYQEIIAAIQQHKGTVSIGGGRFSMGGQVAGENSLHIDMRSLNQILSVDSEAKTMTVQAGATWRDILEVIDPVDLSVKIMQSYANFTVGGSLSVNAHGRYIGQGPIVRSVRSLKVVIADGRILPASRRENPDLFHAVIGGYGGLGVIIEASLDLEVNTKIERNVAIISADKYLEHFEKKVLQDSSVLLHNGDIYPPEYLIVRSETWRTTTKPLTIQEKLQPRDKVYWLEPNVISLISSLPFGETLRRKFVDPFLDNKEIVSWRNYEASYNVKQLEPLTPRWLWTYILQEYFIPVKNFSSFLSKLRSTLQKANVNVVNISIRHALADPNTYLTWAKEDVFSFVIYYKQGTSQSSQEEVASWTQELIQAAIDSGGRHYLPYQILATKKQFLTAYPGFSEYLQLKRKYDPNNVFSNSLIERYR